MNELQKLFPRASKGFLSLNAASANPKPKSNIQTKPLATVQTKKVNPRCRILRIVSYRTRTCDKDNLFTKWHIDALRYAGIIEDDSPEHIELQVSQKKVEHLNQERTEVQLEI